MIIGLDARELQGRPTGTGRYLRNLLRVWTGTTTDTFLAYFNGPAPPDPALEHPHVVPRPLTPLTRGLWWQQCRLPRAARADGVEVFFSPAYSCPLHLHAARVTAVHDLSFFAVPHDFTLRDGLRRRALVAASMRASRALLACSDFTRREIASRFPDLAGRVRHVPLAADGDLPAPPPREAARQRLGAAGPLLLTVGAIFNRRCLPVLLRAVARLARRWSGLALDVVGEDRTHPPLDLASLARSLGLDQRVRLAGYLSEPDLADRYAAADAAVFLSEYEGFGLGALEALARGVPVVAADRPALNELFGSAALLVDPHDEPGLASALDRLLSDPALRAERSARGRELASHFSWAETARRTREALAEAAAGPP